MAQCVLQAPLPATPIALIPFDRSDKIDDVVDTSAMNALDTGRTFGTWPARSSLFGHRSLLCRICGRSKFRAQLSVPVADQS